MIYNLNLEEFETVADQLLTQTELEDLSLLLGHDLDEFIVQSSRQKFTTIEKKGSQIFIKVQQGIFKSLL